MTRLQTFNLGMEIDLYVSDCPSCGVIFAIPSSMEARRRKDKRDFYCPNGHNLHFSGKTQAEKHAEKQAEEISRLRSRWMAQRDQAQAAKVEAAEAKASEIRIRWRVGNGVCPCCQRTFSALAAHVASKHPEFVHQDLEALSVRMRELLGTIAKQTEEADSATIEAGEIKAHWGTLRALSNRGLVEVIDYRRIALTESGWPLAHAASH